ncbi:TenA family transcriptional regulator [Steroidobacter sp. S1-65]|uniref:TenA family transcriptional regulator n=1 Tax=Steroidobacter gossypii TaxID=2805490 RepID=A0ABS1X1A6_9GAMM|nr:iron-containing redox enzyme family protein [Steroidobacter gossypii]MBM0106993.1 TenA family transcriptional regulator [Steroidobacter gossypii]
MESQFVRTGPLMDLASYPQWLQEIVAACSDARRSVVAHEIFQQMSEGVLPAAAMRRFLASFWPVIEQFPQYMAMNLLKVQYELGAGHAMARKYLIRNIRVEQNHVEYWIDWSQGHGLSRDDLWFGWRSSSADALSHWCWHTCERDPLPVAMAATNYAIEGATGEWAAFVCDSSAYEHGFPEDVRKQAMKWLRVHAHYDDTHPWEALEIVATLVGHRPQRRRDVATIESAIAKSYEYMRAAFDECLAGPTTARMPYRKAGRLEAAPLHISS